MRDFTRIPIHVEKLVLIDKASLSNALFYFGITLSFFHSLNPWFLWDYEPVQFVLMALSLCASFVVARTMPTPPVENKSSIYVVVVYALLVIMTGLVNGKNLFGFVATAVQIVVYYYIFRANGELLRRAFRVMSKIMAVLLAVSLVAFMYYLTGHSLPSTTIGDETYTFTNYRLFLVAQNDMSIIPRFQSVFKEPSHMAIVAVFLLMTEIGRWRKWYNMIMLFAVLVSFSLEAYVLLFCLFFLSKWIMHKNFIRSLTILVSFFTIIVIGSFFYNNGDNMFNQLIVMRLEVDDGEVAGNNRTTSTFDAEFESYLSSSDILWGRDMYEMYGNSGYKVYIYENGIVCTFLLFVFYGLILYNPRNKRAALTALCLTFIHFIVRAHMTMSHCFLTMFFMAQWFRYIPEEKDEQQKREHITE